jgi:CRISPR-associated protein Csm1
MKGVDRMDQKSLLDASCRVALAAYLHDLGKFAERARLEAHDDRLETHLQLYCPRQEAGGKVWYTHRHAAYTALAWELVESNCPELIGSDVFPFAAWNDPAVDDSIVNAAARHHRPETMLQWLVATADRVASGFEREEFDKYNAAEDRTEQGRNHYTARQLTLFEQIRLTADAPGRRAELHYRYPLRPLSASSIFPVPADGYETADDAAAQAEYAALWDGFLRALDNMPASHRANWPLWLDHFDSAWACYTQAIPAATAFNVRPEVSLYDHSRTTAALATALWRYHHERDDDVAAVRERLSARGRPDWDEQKLLLVQGDFFGIQEFLFATGGETQRRAAKLLRGRSFYISLLTECAALRVLDALQLPPTSQVINAAGKFLIVAPNTEASRAALAQLQRELDRWFLEHTFGQAGIGLAWVPASGNDFLRTGAAAEAPFAQLIRKLFSALQDAKARRFGLCSDEAPASVFDGFLEAFDRERGVCAIDGRSPAVQRLGEEGAFIGAMAADQISVGAHLASLSRVLVTRESLGHNTLHIPIFGYHVQFTRTEEETGRFGEVARSGVLRRAWDFHLPAGADEPLFSGYARRYINGYVPRMGDPGSWAIARYKGLGADGGERWHPDEPKTLEHLARDDWWQDEQGDFQGTEAVMTLKGDVDDLGRIFERGLAQPSFAKMAALSRQMNAFFAIWLPWQCRSQYPSTYTVFAGGDDFLLIGPWRSTLALGHDMREQFGRYVAQNPDIHFSAGLAMTKPGMPIRQMGELAERALEAAKDHRDAQGITVKDAVTCFGQTVGWQEFGRLWGMQSQLELIRGEIPLSTGYLYGLQHLADMAADLRSRRPSVDSALWSSRFAYRTWRMLERIRSLSEPERRTWQKRLGELLGNGIRQHGSAFKIALFTHLYHHRR